MILLLSILILSNVSLSLAYLYQRPNQSDFGKVPSYLRTYLTVSAVVGFLSLFLSTLGITCLDTLTKEKESETSFFLSTYYGLQCVFFPVSRGCLNGTRNVWEARYILLMITYCSTMISLSSIQIDAPVWIVSLFLINACHSFVNDFILFGFLFC